MKPLKYISIAALTMGFAGAGYASDSSLLVPFSDAKVKAGSQLYIYYGGIGFNSYVHCKSEGKGNSYRGNGGATSPSWENNSNEIWLSTLAAPGVPESGVFRFTAGDANDATVSCDYVNENERV